MHCVFVLAFRERRNVYFLCWLHRWPNWSTKRTSHTNLPSIRRQPTKTPKMNPGKTHVKKKHLMTRWQCTTLRLSGQPKHWLRLRNGRTLKPPILQCPRALWFQLQRFFFARMLSYYLASFDASCPYQPTRIRDTKCEKNQKPHYALSAKDVCPNWRGWWKSRCANILSPNGIET